MLSWHNLNMSVWNFLLPMVKFKFYSCFVDDALLAMKPENDSPVHKALGRFDENLRYTVGMFQKEVPPFLDLELSAHRITIFRKDTNNGLYDDFINFVPWTYRTPWVRSIVTRASHICSTDKLRSENNSSRRFASWNHFPKSLANSIIIKTLSTPSITDDSHDANKKVKELPSIFVFLPTEIKRLSVKAGMGNRGTE